MANASPTRPRVDMVRDAIQIYGAVGWEHPTSRELQAPARSSATRPARSIAATRP